MNTRTIAAILVALVITAEASASPKAKCAPKPQNMTNHTVQRGETLYSIAEKYYGSGLYYVKLVEYNPWVTERGPNKLNIGEVIHVPDPKPPEAREKVAAAAAAPGRTSLDPPSEASLLAWVPAVGSFSLFGRSLYQLLVILCIWFVFHFVLEGVFVWFAAHLTFVKDVSMKKAMRATLQAESLAILCIIVAGIAAFMLFYVTTTSPGNPVTSDVFSKAEAFLASSKGILLSGILLVALYGFLGIRFIPPAFGIQAGRGVAVVVLSVLLPHLMGFYLIGHRMGLIS
jgi:hypothetical protein